MRALIGAAVGVGLVVIGLFAAAARNSQPVSIDIPEAAYKWGHGANAVNVLLVDIRAWDTMGEISVLIVAATGVASMVFRNRRFGAAPRVSDAARLLANAVFFADLIKRTSKLDPPDEDDAAEAAGH